MVLTDNCNPIDFHDSWLKEQVRENIMKETGLIDMLICGTRFPRRLFCPFAISHPCRHLLPLEVASMYNQA
jgi:hypothetical protein